MDNSSNDPARVRQHLRVYVGVFLALMAATVLTVAVSYVHFGAADSHAGNVTVALVIAGLKAALVAGFFMHLMSERRSIHAMLGVTGIFFLGLIGLTVFAAFDVPALAEHLQKIQPIQAIEVPHVP